MIRENILDLLAFQAVAQERSFTKAAAKLGVSQSALSHTIRILETRLGVRLLTRTTRSVAPTDAGERLLKSLTPRLDEIENELDILTTQQGKPSGSIKITASGHAAGSVLWPRLPGFMRDYPDINVEVVIDYGLTNIVEQRIDAGVRFGEQVEKDMIAVRIGPDTSMAVVGSPSYFEGRKRPKVPQDLMEHECINMRLPTYGGFYVWEFEKDGRELNVRVEGHFVSKLRRSSSGGCAGRGRLSYRPIDVVAEHIKAGRLIHVLKDWSPPFTGYHLYYPSRRQPNPAFALLVEALRYRK